MIFIFALDIANDQRCFYNEHGISICNIYIYFFLLNLSKQKDMIELLVVFIDKEGNVQTYLPSSELHRNCIPHHRIT